MKRPLACILLAHLIACGSSAADSSPDPSSPSPAAAESTPSGTADASTPTPDHGPIDPVLVTNELQDAEDAIFHDGFVYVAEGRNGIVRVDATGRIQSVVDPGDEIYDMIANGDELIWSSVSSSQKIVAAPFADLSSTHTVVDGLSIYTGAFAIRGTSLIYASWVDGGYAAGWFDMMRADLRAPGTPVMIATDVRNWNGTADDASYFYFGTSAKAVVERAPIGGGNPLKLVGVQDEGEGENMVLSSTNVFFTTDFGLRTIPKSGGAQKLVFPGKVHSVVSTPSGDLVYWAIDGGVGTKVFRSDANGDGAELLGELPVTRPRIVPTGDAVFVLDSSSTALYRFPHA